MTVHDVDLEREALADYSILMAEATVVLCALAHAAPGPTREEDLADLQAIHAERDDFTATHPLARSLRRLFDETVRAGGVLASSGQISPTTADQMESLKRLTRTIALALDEHGVDPPLDHVNRDLRLLDPECAGALSLEAAVNAAAERLARLI
jgi:hypothetical protein